MNQHAGKLGHAGELASWDKGREAAPGEVNFKGRQRMQGRPKSARGMQARWRDIRIPPREARD